MTHLHFREQNWYSSENFSVSFCWLIETFLKKWVSEGFAQSLVFYEGKNESHFSLRKVLRSLEWVLTYEKAFNEGTFPQYLYLKWNKMNIDVSWLVHMFYGKN